MVVAGALVVEEGVEVGVMALLEVGRAELLDDETELTLEELAIEEVLLLGAPGPNSSTLLTPESATQRFPDESNTIPSGVINIL